MELYEKDELHHTEIIKCDITHLVFIICILIIIIKLTKKTTVKLAGGW